MKFDAYLLVRLCFVSKGRDLVSDAQILGDKAPMMEKRKISKRV